MLNLTPEEASRICMDQCRAMCCRGPLILRLEPDEVAVFHREAVHWGQLHQHCCDDADLEYLIIDSTVVRAHPCAAGAPPKRVARRPRPWAGAAAGSAPRFT